jgi:hypothetical protein
VIAYTAVERLLIGGGIVTFLGVLFALALCNVASDADDRLMEGATQAETNDPYTNADVTDLDEYRNRDVDRARRIHPSNQEIS